MNRKQFVVLIQSGRWGSIERHWTYANTADEAVQKIFDSVFKPELHVVRVVECKCGSDSPTGYHCPYEYSKQDFEYGPPAGNAISNALIKNKT